MSHRLKHRHDAAVRRMARIAAGKPADPSNRARKARMPFICPNCRGDFRRSWQFRLHLVLRSCAYRRAA